MALYTAPKSFLADLHRFDPALRVRWSDPLRCWRIERKVGRGRMWPPSVLETPSAYEDRMAAREGYMPILVCEKGQLDNRVFFTLWYGDMWRRGGHASAADAMEAHEQAQREKRQRDWVDDRGYEAKEFYQRINTVRTLPEKFAHTAHDLGFLGT